jgi:hypothetical protein
VWQVLAQLPYQERFALYGRMGEQHGSHLLLGAMAKAVTVETRRALRRGEGPWTGGAGG